MDKTDDGKIGKGGNIYEAMGNETVDCITNFVEAVHLENHPADTRGGSTEQQQADRADQLLQPRVESTLAANLAQAQMKADAAVIDAERFKASIQQPGRLFENGMVNGNVDCVEFNLDNRDQLNQNQRVTVVAGPPMQKTFNMLDIGKGVSDDDFFHLTCHIEPNLIHKIEKGEYVELEKLLPKDKVGKSGEENHLEWVQRDGGTFLVPAQCDGKIGSFRKWE